ncbi:MAG: hypothetical protein V3V02_12445 [Rhizobiaceae bacterium]
MTNSKSSEPTVSLNEQEAIKRRILYWLSKPGWSFNEAKSILCGVFLPSPGELFPIYIGRPDKWKFLHGKELEQAINARGKYFRAKMAGADMSPQSPQEWISRAIQIGEEPTWLKSAYKNEEFSKFLPSNIKGQQSKESVGGKKRHSGTYSDLVKKAIEREYLHREMGTKPEAFEEFQLTMVEEYCDPEGPLGSNKPTNSAKAKYPTVRRKRSIQTYCEQTHKQQSGAS